MARKVILQDSNNVHILPITRGELVVDSSGNQALHSREFLATTSRPGLMSAEDKQKLDTGAGVSVDSELSNSSTNPVQNKVVTAAINKAQADATAAKTAADANKEELTKTKQILNTIKTSYLKSASVSGNTLTIKDQNDSEVKFYNTTYGIVSSSSNGLAPAIGTSVSSIIGNQADEWVLTSTKGGAPTWRKLPVNAFLNNNDNTTYTLIGDLSGNTFISTLIPSSGTSTTSTVPAMVAASASTAGKAGLVPAPPAGAQGKVLSGAGTWISIPTLSVTDNETGNAVTDVTVSGHSITLKRGSVFSLQGHAHSTSNVTSLTGYSKASSIAALATSDTLNAALGKLEYKADSAWNWISSVTASDTDEYINKWGEIVDFVDSVKEGTDILDEFVTRKTPQIILGQKTFSQPVFVQNTYNNNSYGVRLLGFEDSGYLQLGQISGDGASHKGIISGINGVKMGSLTLNSTITSISGGLTVAGQASFNSVLTALSGVQTTMIYTPGSDSNTYSGGANGQVLKSNGSTIYWATDLNTTYTFENGTNCFYVTPLGGDKQTVTVTPSIANNVTGSGTSGCIAKWNGTNTITSGPAFGTATTTFLRNDGGWASPKDPTVLQTAVSNNYAYPLLLAKNGQTTTTTTGTYFDSGVTLNPYTNTITANITGSAATLGTSTIGGSSKPIYLNKGVPTECSDYGSTIVDISSSDNINFTVTYLNGNTTSFAIAASTAGATNNTAKLYLIGSNTQAADVLSYSNGNVYMQNGTLYLIRTTAASASANNKPALIVGGSDTAAHLEIDANSIIAKNNGTTAGVLTLQDGLTTAANLKLGNLTIGSGNTPMYVSAGVLTASTSNVGSNKKPIYMSSGKLTPFSSSIGSGTNPIYVNSSGELTASTSTIASGKKLMYLNSGVLTASTESVSAGNKLMYLNNGVLTESSSSAGSPTIGVYLKSGTLSQMTYSLNATVNSGTTNYLAYYSGANAISKVTISSSTDTLYILGVKSSGHIPYSATQGSSGVRIVSGSSVYAYGGFYESSDEKLKTILNPIKVDLEDLTKLRKVYFLWKNQPDKKLQIGTIAQDVQKLFPELVGTDDSDYLSVAYDKLSIVALAAIDELYNMVKNLQNENEELKRKLIR